MAVAVLHQVQALALQALAQVLAVAVAVAVAVATQYLTLMQMLVRQMLVAEVQEQELLESTEHTTI